MRGRIIKREDVASLFYNGAKLKKFYGGSVPQSISMRDVADRMELYTKSGKRRLVQGKYNG